MMLEKACQMLVGQLNGQELGVGDGSPRNAVGESGSGWKWARRDAFNGSRQQQRRGEEGSTLGDKHVMDHGSVPLR